jgi:hypothetical protein
MGLMYIMPVSEKETDRVEIKDTKEGKSITLKSYGLPLIFWGYLAGILVVLLAMGLAIKGPMTKMLTMEDPLNQTLAWIVFATILAIPLGLLGFLFYEKTITKSGTQLIITHKLFWIPIWKKTYKLKNPDSLLVEHFLDSPNVAKIDGKQELRAFQNQGYYNLHAQLENDRFVLIDRHSRRSDLNKLSQIMSRY